MALLCSIIYDYFYNYISETNGRIFYQLQIHYKFLIWISSWYELVFCNFWKKSRYRWHFYPDFHCFYNDSPSKINTGIFLKHQIQLERCTHCCWLYFGIIHLTGFAAVLHFSAGFNVNVIEESIAIAVSGWFLYVYKRKKNYYEIFSHGSFYKFYIVATIN